MFEQFKDNVTVARETLQEARETYRHCRDAFKNATPVKKAAWLVVPATILVDIVARQFSLSWEIRTLLVLVLVIIPSGAWARKATRKLL